jgi:hypothetical protein
MLLWCRDDVGGNKKDDGRNGDLGYLAVLIISTESRDWLLLATMKQTSTWKFIVQEILFYFEIFVSFSSHYIFFYIYFRQQ